MSVISRKLAIVTRLIDSRYINFVVIVSSFDKILIQSSIGFSNAFFHDTPSSFSFLVSRARQSAACKINGYF